MVSHEYKFIFIHIPKCAGTSVETLFGHNEEAGRRNAQDHRPLRFFEPLAFGDLPRLISCREVRGILKGRAKLKLTGSKSPKTSGKVNSREFRTYFKFAIVRSPWTRAASWYANVLRDPVHRKRLNVDESIGFKDFLNRYSQTIGLKPQLYWLSNFSGDIGVDRILRFENLEEDFDALRIELGLPPSMKLPHKLQGNLSHYADLYDEECATLVAERYAEEISVFDYCFEDLIG